MKRRPFLLALAAGSSCWPWPLTHAQASADVAALLRAGGCVVMLRHAQTEAGIGDPPGFRVDQCSTQRNLSPEGRAQARRIGEWFKARGLQARAVQSSAWCRCRDTADLAFGRHTVLPALASTFNRGADEAAAQTRVLRGLLDAVPPGQFDVWVTHQVNISSLTGEGPAMGEAFVLGAGGKILARTRFE